MTAFDNFREGCEAAPEGTYVEAKQLRDVIGDAADSLIREVRAMGLKTDNCDGIYKVEEAIYEWIRNANPDASTFATCEGLGYAMGTPAADRVLARLTADRDFLRTVLS
jgi:hypothetical protein